MMESIVVLFGCLLEGEYLLIFLNLKIFIFCRARNLCSFSRQEVGPVET